MPAMTKIVNIRTRVAVKNVNPPICGTVKGIVMTTGDILKCLCKRALVEEVLPDGSIIKLNMSNYYTDNGAGLDAKKNIPTPVKKPTETIERFKVPVSPVVETEKQVVETMTEEDNNIIAENIVIEAKAEPAETVFVTGMSTEADDVSDDAVDTVTETATNVAEVCNATIYNRQPNNKKKKHK